MQNVYDVTTWDPYAILAGDNSINHFYNNPVVKDKMHAPVNAYWLGCIPGAGRRLLVVQQDESKGRHRELMASLLIHDAPISTIPYVAELLDGGVRVLAYNGDRDMACNAAGTEQLLNAMEWKGARSWYGTARGLWAVDTEPAGYAKSLDGLSFVVIINSGHLAPYNRPAVALDLITRFLRNESLYDYDLPNFGHIAREGKRSGKLSSFSTLSQQHLAASETMSPAASAGSAPLFISFLAGYGLCYFLLKKRTNRAGSYQPIRFG